MTARELVAPSGARRWLRTMGITIGVGLGLAFLQFLVAGGEGMVGMVFGLLGAAFGVCASLTAFVAFLAGPFSRSARVRRAAAATAQVASALALAGYLQVAGCVATLARGQYQVRQAKAWCESLLPRLDAYREKNGHYPGTLLELGISTPPSEYTSVLGGYQTFKDGFCFELSTGMVSGWSLSSETRTWQHFD